MAWAAIRALTAADDALNTGPAPIPTIMPHGFAQSNVPIASARLRRFDRQERQTAGMGNCTITTVDLFAGAGGLSLGFERSGLGYEPQFAVEIDPAAARTFAVA